MTQPKIYAGIGSRKTPRNICEAMTRLASSLWERSWLLRSGGAKGADQAFEKGTAYPYMQIFLPWDGYEGQHADGKGFIVPDYSRKREIIAEEFHPDWRVCSPGVRAMHMRNVCQVLGEDCETPADMVICWTIGGRAGGGTGQAIRIARGFNIPVFDLALVEHQYAVIDFINNFQEKK